MPRYGQIDHDYAMTLASRHADADGPIYMLNLMAYREEADYGPDGERGVPGREADDRYAPLEVLAAIGAQICFVADVIDSSEPWDRVAVVRYPTRRSFIEMQSREDFQAKHVHKDAGMARTIIMGTLPVGDLPAKADGAVLLQVDAAGRGDGDSAGSSFSVEGTIIGDGRQWAAVRFAPVADGTATVAATEGGQALLLRPGLQQWQ